jgi:hypothetical protein
VTDEKAMGRSTVSVITPLAIDQRGGQIDREASLTRQQIQVAQIARRHRFEPHRETGGHP